MCIRKTLCSRIIVVIPRYTRISKNFVTVVASVIIRNGSNIIAFTRYRPYCTPRIFASFWDADNVVLCYTRTHTYVVFETVLTLTSVPLIIACSFSSCLLRRYYAIEDARNNPNSIPNGSELFAVVLVWVFFVVHRSSTFFRTYCVLFIILFFGKKDALPYRPCDYVLGLKGNEHKIWHPERGAPWNVPRGYTSIFWAVWSKFQFFQSSNRYSEPCGFYRYPSPRPSVVLCENVLDCIWCGVRTMVVENYRQILSYFFFFISGTNV